MQPVNLFGLGLHADSSVLASENRLNCFYDLRTTETGKTITVRGTPGSYPLVADPNMQPSGLHVVNNILYFVTPLGLFSLDTGGVLTYLASGPVGHPYCMMADNYIQLMIVTGSEGWIYNIGTGVMTQITDVNFPATTRNVTYASGRFLCVKRDTREVYCSDQLDGLSWTSALGLPMFFTKEQSSDPAFTCVAQNGIVAVFGLDTIEFWQDAGLSPVPFQYIPGTTQGYGCKSRFSIKAVNDTTYFLGHGPQGGMGVFAIKGYTVTKVSTPDVDDIIKQWEVNGATFNYTHGTAYNAHGHDFYELTEGVFSPNIGSLLYDATTGIWSTTCTDNTNNSQNPAPKVHDVFISTLFNGQVVFRAENGSAGIYAMDVNAYNDSGAPVQRQVTTKHLRNNGNEFAISELVLLMDTGEVPLGQDFHITLEVSRDGGRTFGSPRPRTLGLTGQYKEPRVKWDRLGSARDFVLRFTMTDPIPFVIAGAEWETSVNG